MMRKPLQLLLIISVITVGLFFAVQAKAASQWVTNPATCSINDPVNFPGQNCTPQRICGDNSGIAQCYNTAGITAPVASAISDTKYDAGHAAGGYLLNCYAAMDAGAPFCDNGGAMWCNRDNTCHDTNHKMTQCTGGVFGASTCDSACISGYQDCDVTPTICEVETNVTNCAVGSNNNIGAACGCQCDSGYVDCNASGPGAGDGCEIQVGGSCVGGGGLAGTWNASCVCVVPSQHFIAGVNAIGVTTSPLLWGTQLGSGDLVNISQNSIATTTFVISNSGQMGIGLTAVSAAAAMEVSSTDKGALLPRLTTTQRNAIAGTPDGLIIYNTDSHRFEYYNSASSSWQGMGEGGSGNIYTAGDGLSLVGNEFRIRINSTLSTSTGILGLASTGVTTGTYGTGVEVPVLTVDAYGRITSIGTTTIYISSAQLSDSSSIAYLNKDQTFIATNTFNSTTLFNGQILINTTTATSSLKIKIAGKAGASFYCDENGENCFDPKTGWATPSITQMNTTTYTTTGDFATSTYTGYQAANYICSSEYPGSHLCETDEILGIIRSQSITYFGTGNVDGAWIAEGPPGFTANANDCNGWTNNTDTRYGPFWVYDNVGGGMGWLAPCNASKPLSCCK